MDFGYNVICCCPRADDRRYNLGFILFVGYPDVVDWLNSLTLPGIYGLIHSEPVQNRITGWEGWDSDPVSYRKHWHCAATNVPFVAANLIEALAYLFVVIALAGVLGGGVFFALRLLGASGQAMMMMLYALPTIITGDNDSSVTTGGSSSNSSSNISNPGSSNSSGSRQRRASFSASASARPPSLAGYAQAMRSAQPYSDKNEIELQTIFRS